ncbi:beta-ketoacyl synthase N-terminal-like domain-containing protein [Nocardia sp. XZ_19_385]|uniref:beta-ketoacyl synthase N-terminal-like domain-containing protein n=1 Tax=Nocardia sp. XZ_19_385 TaxID=2769488 RepID=UPI00188E6E76|nr:beta-ketoacyl synthase N-terminal-like domain-containing protein [Nocardia sp. XZ_19_385]
MTFEPIAIVGRGCVLPGALDPSALWDNIRHGRVSLSTASADRWRLPEDWADSGLVTPIPGIGGFVHGFDEVFDATGLQVPTEQVLAWDPAVQWVIHAGRSALREAGYPTAPAMSGLILGSLGYPSRTQAAYAEHIWQAGLPARSRWIPEPELVDPRQRFCSGLAGRSAARALGADSDVLVVDAACASSLYAIKLACDRLHDRNADFMLAGGVSGADNLLIHLGFAGLGALSRSGRSRPFDQAADGLVPAEGAAVVALMRHEDAISHGHTVLGVIRAIGLSNDGATRGLLTPAQSGQKQAMRAAYQLAGLDPKSVTLLECHATGTTVGDATEVASVASIFGGCPDLPLGSAKGNLGHLLTAAGAAALLKILGAIEAGERPRSVGADAPVDELATRPLRLLTANEPWDGPRRAAINAFGFGGNNAHLVVDAPDLVTRPVSARAPLSHRSEIAIVALGARVGDGASAADLRDAVLAGRGVPRRASLDLRLDGLHFPPRDLDVAPAQSLVLEAAREATAGILLPGNTMVLIGMGCDPEAARGQAGVRHASWAAHHGERHETTVDFGADFSAARVVAAMANVYANRIGSQLGLTGPAFAVSAEEASGPTALRQAIRALRAGEVEAAVVGAVDLSAEPVHSAAMRAVQDEAEPGDAAVVLVLKRLSDVQRDEDDVLAILEPETPTADLSVGFGADFDPADLFGSAHAASGLLAVAVAVLALRHRARFRAGYRADPALAAETAEAIVPQLGGPTTRVCLRAGNRATTVARRREVHVFSGTDAPQALAALESGRPNHDGPARIAVCAESLAEAQARAAAARGWLSDGGPRPAGMAFRAAPLSGETAFVFTNGSAAYPWMGQELMLALPTLMDAVETRFGDLSLAAGWAYREPGKPAGALDQIQAVTVLAALHAEIARNVLGLGPSAALGYSSGESTALLVMGAWTEPERMNTEFRDSELFSRDLAGELRAVREHWAAAGITGHQWSTYLVSATAEQVRAALIDRPAVHLMAITSPETCVLGGEAHQCQAALRDLDASAVIAVDYDIVAHAPELAAVAGQWRDLHLQPTTDIPGVRFYSGATAEPYRPTPERVAQAITDQGLGTIDFVALIERAYADGARIFIEHGPSALCTGWIKRILGDRDHLAVAWDGGHDPITSLYAVLTELAAAGVAMDLAALSHLLHDRPSAQHVGKHLQIAAHPDTIRPRTNLNPATMAAAPQYIEFASEEHLSRPVARTAPAVDANVHTLAATQFRLMAATHAHHLALCSEAHTRFLAHSDRLAQLLRPHATSSGEVPPPTAHPGPTFDRADLEFLATGQVSELFGPAFAIQDGNVRQTRMPSPPMLLVDRVTGIDAEPATLGTGTIWTETDIRSDSWYLDQTGRIPPGLLIEAGQADLLLISWLGVDLANRGERVYRLLGCEATFHTAPPTTGTTLDYEIRIVDHAEYGRQRLFFFEYDCRANGMRQLSIRHGQAGFFSDAELAATGGVLWHPTDQIPDEPTDPVAIDCGRSAFSHSDVAAFADGRPADCFGPEWDITRSHVRTPRITAGQMLLLDEVTSFQSKGGPWARGYLRAERTITADDWFFAGHFHNDPCMPGTLMFEGCMQAMSFYLSAAGFTVGRDAWRFEPVPDQPYSMRCRGQAVPANKRMVYEVFVARLAGGPYPTLEADVLVSVDGVKSLHVRRLAVRLVPDWPLTHWRDSGPATTQRTGDLVPLATLGGLAGWTEAEPVAEISGFRTGYPSLLACAWGPGSQALGPACSRFDSGLVRGPRLPAPPYLAMTRVSDVTGPYCGFEIGSSVVAAYDVPDEAWYFTESPAGVMPLAILMEVALQPCGWLGAYAGSMLRLDAELFIRNLDGRIVVSAQVAPTAKKITTRAELRSIAEMRGSIIQSYEIHCELDGVTLLSGTTTFGYFTAETLAQQVGLPPTDRERVHLTEPSDYRRPALRPGMADSMLLMLDQITGYWPAGGRAGRGRIRAEKQVDAGDWFFKAHFFQDPVMPGSLGVEALSQLLQWLMLERGFDQGLINPQFQPVVLDEPFTWTYRGQIRPTDALITLEAEVIDVVDDAPDAYTLYAEAWLWVDGRRIYHLPRLGMRLRSGPPPTEIRERFTLTNHRWLNDHRPTFTIPTLPMMSVIDRLCDAANRYVGQPITGATEVTLTNWIPLPAMLRTRVTGPAEAPVVTMATWRAQSRTDLARFQDAATAVLTTSTRPRPAPFPPLSDLEPVDDLYGSGSLFHGAAFHYVTDLRTGSSGATATLDVDSGSVPPSYLPHGLLDALTHLTPHDRMERWSDRIRPGCVAFPHRVRDLQLYEPVPEFGKLRGEARFAGFDEDMPAVDLQLISGDRVLVALRLVSRLLPIGGLSRATPQQRRAFLRDREPADGVGLSVTDDDGCTILESATVLMWDSLPGTMEQIYGLSADIRGAQRVATIAMKEHVARLSGVHPHRVRCNLTTGRCRTETRSYTVVLDHRPAEVRVRTAR